MADNEELDLEKSYSSKAIAPKLRRLADALEQGKTFYIQVAGERISIPPHASIEIEYEKNDEEEELEFEIKWKSQ